MFDIRKFIEKKIDINGDPEETREKLFEYAQKHKFLDRISKFSDFYLLARGLEPYLDEHGWYIASGEGLNRLNIRQHVKGLENIPEEGPNLFVSNHLEGFADGMVLLNQIGAKVKEQGRDFRILGSHWMRLLKMDDVAFYVDSTNYKGNSGFNLRSLREVSQYLRKGGDLGFFPSGEASYYKKGGLFHPDWKPFLGRLMDSARSVVPMWFEGPKPGKMYSLLARINPRLRDLTIWRELLGKKGQDIYLTIGEPIDPKELDLLDSQEKTLYVRQAAESLKDNT